MQLYYVGKIYIVNVNQYEKAYYYLDRGSLGCVCLLWMVHSVPLIHETQNTAVSSSNPTNCSVCGVVAHSSYIHVQAQPDDSVSMHFKRSLSDGAGVTSSCGELTSFHFSAFDVERPVETGSR